MQPAKLSRHCLDIRINYISQKSPRLTENKPSERNQPVQKACFYADFFKLRQPRQRIKRPGNIQPPVPLWCQGNVARILNFFEG